MERWFTIHTAALNVSFQTVSPFNMTNAMSLEAVSAMFRDSGNAGTIFNDFVPFLEQIGSTLDGPSVRATPYGGEWA